MQSFISGMVFIELVMNLILLCRLERMGIWGENSTFLLDKASVLSQLKLIFMVFKQVN